MATKQKMNNKLKSHPGGNYLADTTILFKNMSFCNLPWETNGKHGKIILFNPNSHGPPPLQFYQDSYSTPRGKTDKLEELVKRKLNVTRC